MPLPLDSIAMQLQGQAWSKFDENPPAHLTPAYHPYIFLLELSSVNLPSLPILCGLETLCLENSPELVQGQVLTSYLEGNIICFRGCGPKKQRSERHIFTDTAGQAGSSHGDIDSQQSLPQSIKEAATWAAKLPPDPP
jgi:hypothetical protein